VRVNSSGPYGTPLDYYRPVGFTLVQEILLRVVTLIPLTIILTSFYNRSSNLSRLHEPFPIRAPVLQARVGERFFLRRVRSDRGPNVVPRAECRTAPHCGWLVASIESQ
jgi:hypothetical protein